jgi:hypothetical protein
VKLKMTESFFVFCNKNCVHCVHVTAVHRTLEEGMKTTRLKYKLLASVFFCDHSVKSKVM